MSDLFGSLFKPQVQIDREKSLATVDASGLLDAAQAIQDQLNSSLYAGNQSLAAANGQAQQSGWAATQFDPLDELVKNPFQAAALYFRLRMTKAELKAKDIEVAFVRRMGGSVHCAIINQDRILTMIDEDVGAFPSDAFIARIRLLL